MGRYVVPCIVTSWRMEKWKSKDYFKAMLMKRRQTVTVLVYIYSLICKIFSLLNKLFSVPILFSHY